MCHTDLRRCPEVSGGWGRESVQGVKGGRLSLMEPRVGRSLEWHASLGMDFSILFSASACLHVRGCFERVCARLPGKVYRDHVQGWSAMAATRPFSYLLLFFLIFPFILDQGFLSVCLPWFDAPRYRLGLDLQRVHTSSALRVFSSRLLGCPRCQSE